MHHKFISVRAPETVKRFIQKDTVSVLRCERSGNWYESGNGSSGSRFQLEQSVRHTIVWVTET
jgi:hypothetical protein